MRFTNGTHSASPCDITLLNIIYFFLRLIGGVWEQCRTQLQRAIVIPRVLMGVLQMQLI
jgi:hypothetical protein